MTEAFFTTSFYVGMVASTIGLMTAEDLSSAAAVVAWTVFCGLGLIATRLKRNQK